LEGFAGSFSHALENAIEVGGHEAKRTLTTASKLQQGLMRVSGAPCDATLASKLEPALNGDTLAGDAVFQEIQRRIELTTIVGILFNVQTRCAGEPVDIIYQTAKIRQAGRVRNARATEKNHAPFFVRL
jgi:hypothetical protein